jgi:hypothetical protein
MFAKRFRNKFENKNRKGFIKKENYFPSLSPHGLGHYYQFPSHSKPSKGTSWPNPSSPVRLLPTF